MAIWYAVAEGPEGWSRKPRLPSLHGAGEAMTCTFHQHIQLYQARSVPHRHILRVVPFQVHTILTDNNIRFAKQSRHQGASWLSYHGFLHPSGQPGGTDLIR